jgi:pilus assembly protein Flp/PilA
MAGPNLWGQLRPRGAVDLIKGISMNSILRFLRDDSGATAVEYAVMLALIIGVCVGAISFFGSEAGGSFVDTSNKLDNAMNVGGS